MGRLPRDSAKDSRRIALIYNRLTVRTLSSDLCDRGYARVVNRGCQLIWYVLSLVMQIALVVHVVKTGRSWLWMLAIGLLPLLGSLAYIVVELLPAALGGRTARKARAEVRKAIDPERDLREASAQVELSGNVDARRRLGDKLMEHGKFDEAQRAYRAGLNGIFSQDPTLLLGVARAQFELHEFRAARSTLDELIAANPDFKSADGHLLYARALEEEGEVERAVLEYQALDGTYPGAESKLRHGLLLKRLGRVEEARRMLRELVDGARVAPRHYRKAQAKWLDWAASELS